MKKFWLLWILTGVLTSGCFIAPQNRVPQVSVAALEREREFQYQLLLEKQFNQQVRVQRVGFDILTAAVDMCQQRRPHVGIMTLSQKDIKSKLHGAANHLWGLAEYPKILAVHPNSPAAASGLQVKDTIIGAGGTRFRSGATAHKTLRKYLATPQAQYNLLILRNGKKLVYEFPPRIGCDYRVTLLENNALNAHADGARITIYSGMEEFAHKDQELALVMAHELAHNTEGHVQAKKTNAIGGALLGAVVDAMLGTGNTFTKGGQQLGAEAYSVGFENEADYVGMYMLARSGYPLEGAAHFWRRMAVESDGKSIDFSSSHPTSVARLLALEQTAAEIAQKRLQGLPLLPN